MWSRSLRSLPGADVRDFGVKDDDSTDASAGINAAIASLDRSVGGLVILPGKYYVASPVVIPNDFADGARVELRGHGCQLRTDQDIAIIQRRPTDQTEALDRMIGTAVVIEGIQGRGTGRAGQSFIELAATFNSRIISCHAVGVGVGFDLRFCLNARVESCRASVCKTHGFVARTGAWPGADGYNSQSNHTAFVQCRNYAAAGAQSGFYILGTNGVVLDSCIAEGHNPVRNVVFDYEGSPVARHFTIRNLHCENAPTGSHVYIRAGGTVEVDGVWYQSGDVLIEWAQTVHLTSLRNVPYFPGSTPFKTAHAGWGRYRFDNVGDAVDWTNAAKWVGGVVPQHLHQSYAA